jgi:uncharacterized protein affecting Mg2+/Co2+ transport
MISLETKGIFIGVETEFLPQQSDSMQFNFVFMYTILIENKSNDIVQLIKRKWEIADSNGDKRIVEGEGVIGEKPILLPNEKYTYSSGCNLASDYGIVHFDSPDKRGIDVALLYQKKHFKVTSAINIPLIIYKKQLDLSAKKKNEVDDASDDKSEIELNSERVYTRDQLLVTGYLDGEEVNVIVNHWPSRSGGEKKSSPFREAGGALNRKIIDSLVKINPKAKIITMGDLNDGAYNRSVKVALGAKLKKSELVSSGDIYNPFEQMAKEGNASLFYRDAGDIFDQIMVSQQFTLPDYSSFRYWKAGIYNKPFMIQTVGQYKGYPLRHTINEVGFSDHFPVYIYLIKQIN